MSCGFGTAYEGLLRLRLSGRDRLLITGLGPVGLAAAMLGRALAKLEAALLAAIGGMGGLAFAVWAGPVLIAQLST